MGGSLKVTALMLVVEFMSVGNHTLSKAAMSRGMSNFIYVLYSNILAALFLIPCSFLYYRKRSHTPLTSSILCRICILGFILCPMQMLKALGLSYTSPTLASAINNLYPVFTYLLAIICRMEKLDMRIQSSRAKFLGTLVAITGALIVTLYKGSPIVFFTSSSSSSSIQLHQHLRSSSTIWVVGIISLIVGCFLHSLKYILLARVIRDYPEELMVTIISCICVIIQSFIICLIAERDPNAWRLRFDIALISIGYSGILMDGCRSLVHVWSLKKEGVVYTAMFKPLGVVIAIVMGISFLGDTLYLGSLFGAAVIILGFYLVLFGQVKQHQDIEANGSICTSDSSSLEAHLLQGKNMRV